MAKVVKILKQNPKVKTVVAGPLLQGTVTDHLSNNRVMVELPVELSPELVYLSADPNTTLSLHSIQGFKAIFFHKAGQVPDLLSNVQILAIEPVWFRGIPSEVEATEKKAVVAPVEIRNESPKPKKKKGKGKE
jgi:hypothetical protein